MIRPGVREVRLAAMLAVAGCGVESAMMPDPTPCVAPVILASRVAANPDNALSALVTVRISLGDSVAVRFGLAGAPLDSVTPAVAPQGDSVLVPVFGLLPETGYSIQAAAYGCATATTQFLPYTSGALPPDLPRFTTSGSEPLRGYVAFAAGAYGLVIDNTGRVVWYHRFPNGPGLNFEPQLTGRYTARPSPTAGGQALWVELDPLGTVTRTLGCARGLPPRLHDLIALPDGSYWLMCDDTRTMDLSSQGGVAGARVMGTAIQHLTAAGDLLFEWNPFDHFQITDLDPADRAGSSVNWTHGNALDLDNDGNLLVSFRSLSELTKIDTRTGAVLWRMGGRANQFTFSDTSMPPFLGQHGLRVTDPGELLLLDNLGDPTGSRAERYVYDADARTARLVASYGSLPAVTAQVGGTAQSLPGGHVLVAFGNGDRVEEFDAAGNVVWRIEGDPGFVFRAQRILSLYHPVPVTR